MSEQLEADPIWEKKYKSGQGDRYPWNSVITFVYQHAPRDRSRSEIKILEVGCGVGNNLWFAAREGFSVSGIDASNSAIKASVKRFDEEGLKGTFKRGSLVELPFPDGSFDMVIDRAAITCVGLAAGKKAIDEIGRVLKPGGWFHFNPYASSHTSAIEGKQSDDGLTKNIDGGALTGVGSITFYSRDNIENALSAFTINNMHLVEMRDLMSSDQDTQSEWRVIAQKNG